MFEWMLGILERGEGIRLQLEYNTDLHDESTIDRVLHQFRQLLETWLVNLDAKIDALPILTPASIGGRFRIGTRLGLRFPATVPCRHFSRNK